MLQLRIGTPRFVRRRFLVFPLLAVGVLAACGSGPEERRLSIYELKSHPTEKNVAQIREWLSDDDRDVRATALNALVGLGVPDSAEIALHALDDPDGFVRATAAKLVGDLGNEAHVERLGDVLASDPDPVARQRAAESLARLGGPQALEPLAGGLGDPIERVRMASVDGLSKLDPEFAREGLLRLLHEDAVWEIRAEAAHALGMTGDPTLETELEAALDDRNEFVRTAVANALRLLREQAPGGEDRAAAGD